MKIIVLSDTHLKEVGDLPDLILKELADADLVVHAGDFDTFEFYNELKDTVRLEAVAGNSDDYEIIRELPETHQFEVEGLKIGVTHMPIFDDFSDLVYKARELEVDVIIFGHTHRPFLGKFGGVVLLNPGSPTFPRFSLLSFAEIFIDDTVEIRIRGVDGEDLRGFRFDKRRKGCCGEGFG